MSGPLDLTNTYGAATMGAMATLILYGITVLQTYFYFLQYPKDSPAFKLLVASLCLLDSLHIVLVCHVIYHYLVTNYFNPIALLSGVWSLYASVAANVVIACAVQIFFTMRIYHLSGPRTKHWLTTLVTIFVILHFCFGVDTVVKFTNMIINRLMLWAVNRCLLTAAVAVAETIVFCVTPSQLWFISIDFVIGKLYCNSLLATLNSRDSIRTTGQNNIHGIDVDSKNVVQLSSFPATSIAPSGARSDNESATIQQEFEEGCSSSEFSWLLHLQRSAADSGHRSLKNALDPPPLPKNMDLDLGPTFGAAYVGSMAALILYGITTLQAYFYFLSYPRDGGGTKLLVTSLWYANPCVHVVLKITDLILYRALDTLHVILISHAMYHYLITNYANPLALQNGTWSLYTSVGLNQSLSKGGHSSHRAGIVVFDNHPYFSFFTKRIYDLSRSRGPRLQRSLTTITAFLVAGHFAFGIETVAELFIKKKLSRISEITLNSALPFALLAVLSDILVAGALCGLLWHERSQFRDTNELINQLIKWAINRCLLTCILAIVEIVVFAVNPKDFWFLAIDFVIGKLYANSLLATLNSRKSLKGKAHDLELDATTATTVSFRMAPTLQTVDTEDASRSQNLVRIPQTEASSSECARTDTDDVDRLDSATPFKYREPSLP
ncbi:hypothetical protein GLOTRDRAFT_139474 [Gloeophyllum trabeum ATCC 11539]|uniref:DUF6534 domain-containing protein n=1 Tax=Gloeophyllum trabeum (strain ATCC 11539 / FP-39264 / Madison 617) TaxID=670483 RepID=S7Q3R8_GLOTA|nr:uncharacterized protein GLOTRDRAFT_139474 [Gloeophyllum trabeum ATCC 11539]EPQ54073.1 hypothetical protein GLOTRDRAFT_139474 [Gloeophyllum trabeum ATCC 11539]